MHKNILINAIGIQDSGGITVIEKLFDELRRSQFKFLIICSNNKNINDLVDKYSNVENFEFILTETKSFLYRLYYENIVFRKIIKESRISFVYNFSGSAQFFLPVPQITKVQNLLFYSRRIDKVYFQSKQYSKWIKQVLLKRIVFHSMVKQAPYIEVQSSHMKEYISDFIDVSKKKFFVKSDIELQQSLFIEPRHYDFSRKVRFLYIVGPHFEYQHKNFSDFVNAMLLLKREHINFEIIVTLTKDQLDASSLWDEALNSHTTFLGYVQKDVLKKQFCDNTILLSTSVIESLGLHVIEAVQNGILAVVPNEKYSLDVYGNDILTYNIFNENSLLKTVENIYSQEYSQISDRIKQNQQYLIKNETSKYKNIVTVFDQIMRG